MFCPNCNAFLQEKNLLKSNVKKWENADIEYDARCPACSEEIGRMSWGKLEVRPDLLEKQQARIPQDGSGQQPQEPAVPPVPKIQGDNSKPLFNPPSVKGIGQTQPLTRPYCPHCGGDLPEDSRQLPRR